VNKPPGFSVQGGSDISRNLFSLMAARYRKEMVYISHRLDKPTSGIVALPKNIKTAQLLGKAFESREGIEKYYLTITEGIHLTI
jgi:23S rRNA-/tRNA-specific pseudouridylate synthase